MVKGTKIIAPVIMPFDLVADEPLFDREGFEILGFRTIEDAMARVNSVIVRTDSPRVSEDHMYVMPFIEFTDAASILRV